MWTKLAIGFAALLFVITLIARLPARALTPLLAPQARCERPAGTVWQGSCDQLSAGGIALGPIYWRLRASALLHARVAVRLTSEDPRARGSLSAVLDPDGDLEISGLQGTLPLDGGLPLIPSGLSGTLRLAVAHARIERQRLVALSGSAVASDVYSALAHAHLGTLQLRFLPQVPGRPLEGQVSELSGPLSLQARVQLLPSGAYQIQGSVAARPEAGPNLRHALKLLGAPNTQGRYGFSLAGTL